MSMSGKQNVKHIADLARIEFTDAELEKFEPEFDSVLNFIGELSSADTGSVPELSPLVEGVQPLAGMRDDALCPALGDPRALMDAAPKMDGRFISVRAVF